MDQAIQDAMNRICECATEKNRSEWLQKPRNCDGITIATDGVALLAANGEHGLPRPPEVPVKLMKEWLARKGDAQHGIELANLLHWLGTESECDACKRKREIECSRCHGEKYIEHRCNCPHCHFDDGEECPTCDGYGTLPCKCTREAAIEEQCRIFGRRLDRRVLRRCLPLGRGPLTVDTFIDPTDQVIFRHADWTLIVMPIRETEQPVPVEFPEAEAAQ